MEGLEIIGSAAGLSGATFAANWAITQYRINQLERDKAHDKESISRAIERESLDRKEGDKILHDFVKEKVEERKQTTDALSTSYAEIKDSMQQVLLKLTEIEANQINDRAKISGK